MVLMFGQQPAQLCRLCTAWQLLCAMLEADSRLQSLMPSLAACQQTTGQWGVCVGWVGRPPSPLACGCSCLDAPVSWTVGIVTVAGLLVVRHVGVLVVGSIRLLGVVRLMGVWWLVVAMLLAFLALLPVNHVLVTPPTLPAVTSWTCLVLLAALALHACDLSIVVTLTLTLTSGNNHVCHGSQQ